MELEMAREKLAQEEAEMRELNAKVKMKSGIGKEGNIQLQNREWNLHESEHRSAQLRTQRELEALQSLSQSLANENKGLREERAELEERIGELREKASAKNEQYKLVCLRQIHTREGRIRRVAELLNEFLEKYRLSSGRVRQQMGRQTEE